MEPEHARSSSIETTESLEETSGPAQNGRTIAGGVGLAAEKRADHGNPSDAPKTHAQTGATFRSGSPTRYSFAAFSHSSLRRTSAGAPRRPASIFSRTFPKRQTGCG